MKKFLVVVAVFSFLVGFSQVARNADITQEVGFSARMLSLGNSNLGEFTNAFDVSLNPSLLAKASKTNVGYTHNNHFGGIIQLDNISFVSPIENTSFNYGLSLFRLQNSQAFDSRSIISTDGNFDFGQLNLNNNNDFGLKFSLGKRLDSLGLDLGAELGIDLLTVENFSRAFALGLDVGVNKSLDSLTTVSLVIENAFGRYYFWNQSVSQLENLFLSTDNYIRLNSLAIQLPYLRGGVNREVVRNKIHSLVLSGVLGLGYGRESTSLLRNSSFNISPGLGLEGGFYDVFFVRAGVNSFSNTLNDKLRAKLSVGLGFYYSGVRVDYALSNFLSQSIPLQQHVISINYAFNAKNKLHNSGSNPRRY